MQSIDFDSKELALLLDNSLPIEYEPMDYHWLIDKYYPPNNELRDILIRHSHSVGDLAVDLVRAHGLDIKTPIIMSAAMIHDIGICMTDAPGIHCHGSYPYICHGLIGAHILLSEGAPLWCARIAARHTGAGLTTDDIIGMQLPLPHCDLTPVTTLEKLICYADKFYSKSGDMERKTLNRVRASMARFGTQSIKRFEDMHREFGIKEPQS